jgi:hypothetical protein
LSDVTTRFAASDIGLPRRGAHARNVIKNGDETISDMTEGLGVGRNTLAFCPLSMILCF